MKRFLDYNKKLKERAKYLKENMTKPEKKLRFDFFKPLMKENSLNNEIGGKKLKIYSQRMINNFIVDFYIPKVKLIIEIDWESHFDEQGLVYDEERTSILEWLWLKVIRFTNNEVMNNFDWVCIRIEEFIKK